MNKKPKQLLLKISVMHHRLLKIEAARRGLPMKGIIIESLKVAGVLPPA